MFKMVMTATLLTTVSVIFAGILQNAKVAATTYSNYLQEVTTTPIYYPKTNLYYNSNVEGYGCEKSYDDPDGDCITGRGGIDYPVFNNIPITDFNCKQVRHPGYYADIDAYCQVFHICEVNGRQHSVLCPKGTVFNQEVLVCDWWYNVDCSSSIRHYEKNGYIYEEDPAYRTQSEYGSRIEDRVPRQYEPYEEEMDYYDVVEPPYAANTYNRRNDYLETTDETTADNSTTTATTITLKPTTTTTSKHVRPAIKTPKSTTAINVSSRPTTIPKIDKDTATDTVTRHRQQRLKKITKDKHQKKSN